MSKDRMPGRDPGEVLADARQRAGALLAELRALFPIGAAGAEAYLRVRGAILEDVNRSLLSRDDIEKLLGGRPRQVMTENHRNHVEFMTDVFALDLPELIVQVVPWVYRTYMSHGFSIEYFPLELRAWKQAVSRHLGAESQGSIVRVYEWLISTHDEMLALSRTNVFPLCAEPVPWSKETWEFCAAVLRGDTPAELDTLRAVRSPEILSRLAARMIQPAMYQVGKLWEAGEISAAQEHLASMIVARGLAVGPRRTYVDSPRGRAVIAAAPNEFHDLGAQIVADLLAMDGWFVRSLGANTPGDELLDLCEKTHADLLGISVSMPFNLQAARRIVRNARRRSGLKSMRVIVGGLAVRMAEDVCEVLGADGWAPDAQGVLPLVAKLRAL